jgi:hypothetical protein
MKNMAKGLECQSKGKKKVNRPKENTCNVEILIVGIEIDTIKNRRNGICISKKPLMQIVLGWRAHYGHGLFKVQGPRINNGVEIRH